MQFSKMGSPSTIVSKGFRNAGGAKCYLSLAATNSLADLANRAGIVVMTLR